MSSSTRTGTRRVTAGAFALALVLGGVACSDEDGDGGVTDEEVDQIDETVDSVGEEVQEEVDRGTDEVEMNE